MANMLCLTHIRLVVRVLVCACVILHIKWRRLSWEVYGLWRLSGHWSAIIFSLGILFCSLKLYFPTPPISGFTSSTLFPNAISNMTFLKQKQTFQVVLDWVSHQLFSIFLFNLEDSFSGSEKSWGRMTV